MANAPDAPEVWSILNAGTCKLVVNHGALRLTKDGTHNDGASFPLERAEWTGACGADGLATGRGALRLYFNDHRIANYFVEYSGDAQQGALTGPITTTVANFNDRSRQYKANPPESMRFSGGCHPDEDVMRACKPADGAALHRAFVAGGGRRTEPPLANEGARGGGGAQRASANTPGNAAASSPADAASSPECATAYAGVRADMGRLRAPGGATIETVSAAARQMRLVANGVCSGDPRRTGLLTAADGLDQKVSQAMAASRRTDAAPRTAPAPAQPATQFASVPAPRATAAPFAYAAPAPARPPVRSPCEEQISALGGDMTRATSGGANPQQELALAGRMRALFTGVCAGDPQSAMFLGIANGMEAEARRGGAGGVASPPVRQAAPVARAPVVAYSAPLARPSSTSPSVAPPIAPTADARARYDAIQAERVAAARESIAREKAQQAESQRQSLAQIEAAQARARAQRDRENAEHARLQAQSHWHQNELAIEQARVDAQRQQQMDAQRRAQLAAQKQAEQQRINAQVQSPGAVRANVYPGLGNQPMARAYNNTSVNLKIYVNYDLRGEGGTSRQGDANCLAIARSTCDMILYSSPVDIDKHWTGTLPNVRWVQQQSDF